MVLSVEHYIQSLIDLETEGWNTKNPDLFLSIIHPDMVWAWPPSPTAHDPIDWILRVGRFNYDRWLEMTQLFMDTHTLIHNRRVIKKILMTDEQDGALAVVDVDTLFKQNPYKDTPWSDDGDGNELHILGRAAKTYTTVNGEWKLISQPGTMQYPVGD